MCHMKNITLSADETLIEKARDYARAHQTTLNQLVRDYLDRLVQPLTREAAAAEFARLARERAGCSSSASRPSRESLYQRGTPW